MFKSICEWSSFNKAKTASIVLLGVTLYFQYVVLGSIDGVWITGGIIILSLIWFGNHLGNLGDNVIGMKSTPGCAIVFIGWLLLLAMFFSTVVIVIHTTK